MCHCLPAGQLNICWRTWAMCESKCQVQSGEKTLNGCIACRLCTGSPGIRRKIKSCQTVLYYYYFVTKWQASKNKAAIQFENAYISMFNYIKLYDYNGCKLLVSYKKIKNKITSTEWGDRWPELHKELRERTTIRQRISETWNFYSGKIIVKHLIILDKRLNKKRRLLLVAIFLSNAPQAPEIVKINGVSII